MSRSRGALAACRRIIVAALVGGVLASLLPTSAALAAGLGCTREESWAEMDREWAAEVRDLTDAYRATLGLGRLEISGSLTKAAEWKAAHMANYDYFSHDDQAPPVDRTWDERIEDCGYTYGMGENIAYGYRSPSAVVQGWIGSTGHRRNIEDANYKAIGVGAALDAAGTPYWVQIFGTHNDGAASTPEVVEPTPVAEPDGGTDESGDVAGEGSDEVVVEPAPDGSAGAADDTTGADAWSDNDSFAGDDRRERYGRRSWLRRPGIRRWYGVWSILL